MAATLLPSQAHIDDPELEGVRIELADVREQVRSACTRLKAHIEGDPDSLPRSLREGWQYLEDLPDTRPEVQRAGGTSSLDGLLHRVLSQMVDSALLTREERYDGKDPLYTATERYRLMVSRNAGSLLEVCHLSVPV